MKIEFEGEHVFEIAEQMTLFLMNMGIGIAGQLDDPGTGEPGLDENEKAGQAPLEPDPEETPEKDTAEPDPVPEKPAKAKPKSAKKPKPKAKAKPEPEPETEPEQNPESEADQSPADAKIEAIEILMKIYDEGGAVALKGLLSEFGIKKFGEVPDDRGPELLERANSLMEDLKKEPA